MASERVESVQRSRDEVEREARRRCNERARGGSTGLSRLWEYSRIRRTCVYREYARRGAETAASTTRLGLLSRLKLSPTSYCDLGKGLSTLAILGRKLLFADPGLQLSTRSKTSLQIRSFRSSRTLQCLFCEYILQQPLLNADTSILGSE